MTFWTNGIDSNDIALVDQHNRILTYEQLHKKKEEMKEHIEVKKGKSLGFLICNNATEDIIMYLAALSNGDALCLLNSNINDALLTQLIDRYSPDWVYISERQWVNKLSYHIQVQTDQFSIYRKKSNSIDKIHPELAILLTTSGTTGNPKLVKLSYDNIMSNAKSISEYLKLNKYERAITSLPMSYSYGLSVINSHLYVGATLLVTNDTIISKSFWDFFRSNQATSLAGVPYTYQMLKRLQIEKLNLSSLKTLTQAGGRLSSELVRYFYDASKSNNWDFYVMYGQTEATARISYVPPERLESKLDSIGIAIPGGELSIDSSTSELIYKGPNVMLGYAENRSDLGFGDENKGVLFTGDITTKDSEGFYYIIGRKKRFIKLFGLRVNLDDIEKLIEAEFKISVACIGNDERLIIVISGKEINKEVKEYVSGFYKLHTSVIEVKYYQDIPKTDNSKINYSVLIERELV